ncbi:MAG: manganese efflux pump MntP family protein [Oscillatoria sp. PMC 1051.18]|nr:manganese efflux pump MntP family protein [Oscillatoria sp. PMC 1050.18]MEC5029035.1 manganese efflux pump MntP family protein [Oscillatoria sp. PMC 1051.18]
MTLITILSIALGLAADAFAVSICSGLAIRRIKINKALKIALFFGGFQALMPLIGWIIGLSFRVFLTEIDHWIAFVLLSFLGGKMIYEAIQEDDSEVKENPLDTYVLISLAIATSLDAFAVGLGFSVLNAGIVPAATAIGVVTFFLCFMGVFIGHQFGTWFESKVEIIGGVILIGIGSKILLEHLLAVPIS